MNAATNPPVTFAERGTRYMGLEHARITQTLKSAMADSQNWRSLMPDQREALEMIQHKVGRQASTVIRTITIAGTILSVTRS